MSDWPPDHGYIHYASPRGGRQTPGGALQIIQRAVNDVMSRRGLYNRHEAPFKYDHPADPVGPRTIDRLNWLVTNGYGPDLRNALVVHRFGYAQTQPNYAAKIQGGRNGSIVSRNGSTRHWAAGIHDSQSVPDAPPRTRFDRRNIFQLYNL
jgi:hypothetical protein